MSASSLAFPNKADEVADDLESFYHVLELCALQFHPHALSGHEAGPALADHLKYFYDQRPSYGGALGCSCAKYALMLKGDPRHQVD